MAIVERIPQTNIRLKHLVKVYSLRSDGPIPLIRSAEDITANPQVQAIITSLGQTSGENAPTKLIGTMQTINITSSRDNQIYRVLNYDLLGKIKEVYPGLPDYTAHVSNVALFKTHLVDAFQAATKDVFSGDSTTQDGIVPCFNIYNQISPLIIKIDVLAPGTANTDITRSVILWDAWFKQSNLEFSVEDVSDLAIMQESDVTFAWPIIQG
jgi:hypothetical protein